MSSDLISKLEGLAKDVEQEAEKEVVSATGTVFDSAWVDIRNELPALVAKLGVNTSDVDSVMHGVLTLVVSLLEAYGPAEIREVLSSSSSATAAPAATAAETPAK
jgi:hypothetical protein